MKDTPSSWPQTDPSIFRKEEADTEPFTKAPAPSVCATPDALSRFTPDPLLAITPEKPLQQRAQAEDTGSTSHDAHEGKRKGRQRVRFAPGTITSPSSKMEIEKKGTADSKGDSSAKVDCRLAAADEESVPRSFSAVSQKLYQPGRYCDRGEATDPKLASSSGASKSFSGTSAPKRYTVETQGSKTSSVPSDRSVTNITSDYSNLHKDRPVTATIVRHKVANVHDDRASSTKLKEAFESALNSELQEAFGGSPSFGSPQRTPPRSRSASPAHRHTSPHRPRKVSPFRNRRSPSISPSRVCSSPSSGRGTPMEELSEVFTPDLDDNQSERVVRVIREAAYQPKHNKYVFPFGDGDGEERRVYDSSVENPLARPEFNSTLKISQELKSMKEKRPDTWGAVSQKLKTCDRKRTEIQEKASSRVNIQMQSGLFSDLVGVDVPLDDLCQDVEKGITLRAPSPKPTVLKVPIGKEPDLMEFFSLDLQQELPDLTLTGIQPITASLTTADPILAFDLYRHNRVWNGLTDS